MPKFVYKAKKGLEQVVEGSVEAQNQEEALSKLLIEGLFPISIEEFSSARTQDKKTTKAAFEYKFSKISSGKITSNEILLFTRKLATLTRAKVELLSSLKVLYEQTENGRFREIILEIYNSTKEGKPFSESLIRYPRVFSLLFVNIIKSGEASGRLDSALDQISEFLTREESLRNKVSVALAYPALLLVVGLVSIFVLINFVVPKLAPIFTGLGKELPLITKVILNVSMLSNKIWFWGAALAGVFILTIYFKKGNTFLSSVFGKLKRNIPVVKRLVKNQELAHFSRSLCLLLSSGVSALKSLEIATLNMADIKSQNELKKVCQDVASGQSIAKSMEEQTTLPNFFTKMIAVGEQSGRLTEVLDEISHSYTQQVESDIAIISSLLEPVLILGLGVILGTIVLAILLPTFQITQLVH